MTKKGLTNDTSIQSTTNIKLNTFTQLGTYIHCSQSLLSNSWRRKETGISSSDCGTSWNINSGLYAMSDGSVLTRVRKESLYYTAPLYAVRWSEE